MTTTTTTTVCCETHDGGHVHGCTIPRGSDGREHRGECSRATTTMPCPEWCDRTHVREPSEADGWHTRTLAQTGDGILGQVEISRPVDPEDGPERVGVWLWGEDVRGVHDETFTASDLRRLAAMFALAAAELEAVAR